jgi:phosphohistidine phosphatase
MKVLVLARHAKAEVVARGQADHARVLEPQGRRDAHTLGVELAEAGFEPDIAYVSDAARTVETWEGVAAAWDTDVCDTRPDLYRTSVAVLLDVLRETPPGASHVIVIGHQPIMSSTAIYLAGPGSRREALARLGGGLRTATAAVLELDGTWMDLGKGGARLRAIVGRDNDHG